MCPPDLLASGSNLTLTKPFPTFNPHMEEALGATSAPAPFLTPLEGKWNKRGLSLPPSLGSSGSASENS